MKVDVCLDTGDDLVNMSGLSKWFSDSGVIPNIGEHIFPEKNEDFPDFVKENEFGGSGEWVIIKKFYHPFRDEVIIHFMDVNHIKP